MGEPTDNSGDGFVIGDRVTKVGGDYQFSGFVQAVFVKRSGALRYVVENSDGLLHIFNGNQLVAPAHPAQSGLAESSLTARRRQPRKTAVSGQPPTLTS